MEQRNNMQNSMIFKIEDLLNKMSHQVDFLIRKNITPNQLDIDLLMENTRELYNTLCSVRCEDVKRCHDVMENEEITESEEVVENEDVVTSEEVVKSIEVMEYDEEPENEDEIEVKDEEDDEETADIVWDFTNPESESEEVVEEPEEVEDEEVTEEPKGIEDEEGIEDEDTTIIVNDSDSKAEEDSGIRTYKIVRDNVHTLGDILEKAEDNSLAARLQRKPVSDLISAIGINDKFLFLNELFGGSMEKYNKSIRSLNSFSTLLGAKTYLSELQIEFQWDVNSDAYKKLSDLIERRFM